MGRHLTPNLRFIPKNGHSSADHLQYIYVQERCIEEMTCYFCVNTSAEQAVEAVIQFPELSVIWQMDLETGEQAALGEFNRIDLSFEPGQSHVLLIKPKVKKICDHSDASQDSHSNEKMLETYHFAEQWDLRLGEPNVLTLDYARYRINEGEWSEPQYVLKIQETCISYKKPVFIELEYTFQISENMSPDCYREWSMGIEDDTNWYLSVNGHQVKKQPTGWFRDHQIKTLGIGEYLKHGVNRVNLSREFQCSEDVYAYFENPDVHEGIKNKLTFDTEVESIYILGYFGVESFEGYSIEKERNVLRKGRFILNIASVEASIQDVVPSGTWFYAGNLFLSQKIKLTPEQQEEMDQGARFIVKWDEMQCPASRIWIDDQLVHEILWRPYEFDITEYIRNVQCNITLELLTSCRNCFGPHHHISGDPYFVGPTSFTDRVGWVDREFTRIWTDDYAFVQVGLKGFRGEIRKQIIPRAVSPGGKPV